MCLLEELSKIDEDQIQSILESVMQRYGELFPDWEVNYFSIPRFEDRNTHIDQLIRMLQTLKE